VLEQRHLASPSHTSLGNSRTGSSPPTARHTEGGSDVSLTQKTRQSQKVKGLAPTASADRGGPPGSGDARRPRG